MPQPRDLSTPALLDTALEVTADIDLDVVLARLLEGARRLSGARYAALGILEDDTSSSSEPRRLASFVTVGMDEDTQRAIGDPPQGKGLLGRLIQHPTPLRLDDLRTHPDSVGFPTGHPVMTHFLGVPVTVRGRVFGNLYLTDRNDGTPFTDDDVAAVAALAALAGAAINHARLFAESERRRRDVEEAQAQLAVLEDRDRIARDLHDLVIQRLFATGLSLQGARRLASPALQERIDATVEDLDTTIHDIRATIFDLHRRPGADDLHAFIDDLVHEASAKLGIVASVRIDGPVESGIPDQLRPDIAAVLVEGLSNAARHGHASRVDVQVAVEDSRVLVTIRDDGSGLTPGTRESGLANLRARADRWSGNLQVGTVGGGGTELTWTVPVT